MIRGLYSSAGALQFAERNQEVIAHNLANANMPGFRRQMVAFDSMIQQQAVTESSSDVAESIATPAPQPTTIFEPGDLHYTQRPLDVALKGDGFFVVEGSKGPLYTRNGVFELNVDGVLQTGGGMPVSGVGGKITIPPGTVQIVIREDGTVVADNNDVGQIKLAAFKDNSQLLHAGTTLFEAPAGVRPAESQAIVQQGYRESSNVQVVDEMVRMIAGMRMYEASQRALRAISDAVEQRTNGQVQ